MKRLANEFLTKVKKSNFKMNRVISHLSFDSVICKDIKQLVEDFEPGKIAKKSQNQFLISTIQTRWKSSILKKTLKSGVHSAMAEMQWNTGNHKNVDWPKIKQKNNSND